MEAVPRVIAIVYADDIDVIRYGRGELCVPDKLLFLHIPHKQSLGYGSCGVKLMCYRAHRAANIIRLLGKLYHMLLVADGPHYDRRMITVVPDHLFKYRPILVARGHKPGLFHYKHSKSVAGIKKLS